MTMLILLNLTDYLVGTLGIEGSDALFPTLMTIFDVVERVTGADLTTVWEGFFA